MDRFHLGSELDLGLAGRRQHCLCGRPDLVDDALPLLVGIAEGGLYGRLHLVQERAALLPGLVSNLGAPVTQILD